MAPIRSAPACLTSATLLAACGGGDAAATSEPRAGARGDAIVQGGRDAGSGAFATLEGDLRAGEATRIDDRRLNRPVPSIDAHPKRDRIVFVHNSQLFEMALGDGKPSRTHAHGVPLASAACSPDGKTIAFVFKDPLDEASRTPGPGYPMFIYQDGEASLARFSFIPGGSLDWVK